MKYPPHLSISILSVLTAGALAVAAAHAGELEKDKSLPQVNWLTVKGDTLSWEAMRQDRPLVVVFWATWCARCKKETPQLQKVQADFANAGNPPVWAWTSLGEPAEKVATAAAKRELGGHILVDPKEENAERLDIHFVPTVLVADPAGTVVYTGKPSVKKLTQALTSITGPQEKQKESTHD